MQGNHAKGLDKHSAVYGHHPRFLAVMALRLRSRFARGLNLLRIRAQARPQCEGRSFPSEILRARSVKLHTLLEHNLLTSSRSISCWHIVRRRRYSLD